MLQKLLWMICLAIMAIDSAIILLRHKRWDGALRLFSLLILITFVTEVLNFLLDYYRISRNPVSHVFSIFELSITTAYFLFTNWKRPRVWSLLWVCVAATALGIGDIAVQSFRQYNTIMLMIESFAISAM